MKIDKNFLGGFSRSLQISNFMKIRPVGVQLFHPDEHSRANRPWVLGTLNLRRLEVIGTGWA